MSRFEKLFAGHYVGDLARLVLLDLAENGLIFGGHMTDKLKQWKSVSASHVSNVEKCVNYCLLAAVCIMIYNIYR